MNWILGNSKKTSLQGIIAAIIIVVMSVAGITGTPVPQINADTNTILIDGNGDVVYSEPQPFDPAMMVLAASLLGIGRTARDSNVSSEGTITK